MIKDGWLDWVQKIPGPRPKVNGWSNPVDGMVLHSAVGYRSGLLSQVNSGMVSWHLTILQDGTVWQHYPLNAQCWHSASWGNNSLVGIEHEGGVPPSASEPLTPAQLAASILVVREILEYRGLPPIRSQTLWEHNELSSTSCPSGRIPWAAIFSALTGEEWPEDEGDRMVIISKRKIWPVGQREGTDWYKSYLVTGRTFKHIPDASTYDSLRAMGLEDHEPDATAWAFISDGATFIE